MGIMQGPVGDYIIQQVVPRPVQVAEEEVALLQMWRTEQQLSPFEQIFQSSNGAAGTCGQQLSQTREPAGNMSVWSHAEAAEITARVLAEKHVWTTQSFAMGSGMFLLGYKYGGNYWNGSLAADPRRADPAVVDWLWKTFGDVFEQLRASCETTFGMPARLQTSGHYPPTFIVHMPSLVMTREVSSDVHADKMPEVNKGRLSALITRDLRSRLGWEEGECDFDAQLSLLAALSLPPGGAGLHYWAADHDNGTVVKKSIDHSVGRAIVLESSRPHSIRQFAKSDTHGLEPRMVIHAFVVPCWSQGLRNRHKGSAELTLFGPMGR